MCGRFVQVWNDELQTYVLILVPLKPDPAVLEILTREAHRRYNLAPTRTVAVLTAPEEGPRVEAARWGFPLPNAGKDVFNTRIETAFTSPLWRGLLGKHNAIVPAQGFYEWKRAGRRKQPHFIQRTDGKPLLMAAVTAVRPVGDGSRLCASILTCPPNETMKSIHDRMPVILEEDEARQWLNAPNAGQNEILTLAAPAGDVLTAHEVSAEVNSTQNQGSELMQPVGSGRQARLF